MIKPRRNAREDGNLCLGRFEPDPALPPRRDPVYFQQCAGSPLRPVPGDVGRNGARGRRPTTDRRVAALRSPVCLLRLARPARGSRVALAKNDQVRAGHRRGFGLRGLFGIDFLLDDAGRAWLTEINPRYTASVEVFEMALGLPLLADHVRAVVNFADENRSRQLTDDSQGRLETARRSSGGRMCGKAIVYAPFTLRAPSLADLSRRPEWSATRARLADRPCPGTLVPAGAPFCTVLIEVGETRAANTVLGITILTNPVAKEAAGPLAPFEPALSWLQAELEPCRETSVGSYSPMIFRR